ncbi:MAG: DUF1016 family protein [Bacilli bacterium]|nr:DUF1016 family protein [Bacilli bacterium]
MNYYKEIKKLLINNEVYKKVKDYSKNRNDLETYYNVGKLLYDAGSKYGDKIIENYSKKLISELGKGYSVRNLRNMRQYYKITEKWQTVSAKLTWSHFCEILWFNEDKILYYIDIAEKQNLSVRQLREKIKNNDFERLPEKTKSKIKNNKKQNINDLIKNPIKINTTKNYEKITEKILHNLILDNIENFMMELGSGYSFIGSEYKIKIGNRYNYIDLLLFNYIYNSFVVIELKVTELKKEHIGQIKTYMNYIDKNIKTPIHDKTIGIIIVKKDNDYIMEYCSDERIYKTTYKVN